MVQQRIYVGAVTSWDNRVAVLWESCGEKSEAEFLAAMQDLIDELGVDDPRRSYQRASALDYVGRESEAEPLYREAIGAGLDGVSRLDGLRCRLQLASTLRNLGQAQDALAVLEAINAESLKPEQRDWLDSFLALCQVSAGRERDGARTALLALSRHLTEYTETVPREARNL